MRAQYFINFTLISLISICGFAVLNKMQFGFYGLAWGSMLFSLIFIILAIREFMFSKNAITTIEFIGLALISFVFFSKGWIFLFSGIHAIYMVGLVLLIIINLWSIRLVSKQRTEMTGNIYIIKVLLRVAVIIFLVSELMYIWGYDGTMYLSVIALIISIATFIFIVWKQVVHFYHNRKLKNVIGISSFNSYWLLLGFILFFSYRIAVNYGFTDEVKFQRLPTEYVELFYRAENGDEEPIDGKYEYEVYLEQYEATMDQYIRN